VKEDTPNLGFLYAGSGADLLYDLKTNNDFTVVRIADREIAGVDGVCFTLTGNRPPGSSRLQPGEIHELCLGDGEFSIVTRGD
jgi:hypothetical protein